MAIASTRTADRLMPRAMPTIAQTPTRIQRATLNIPATTRSRVLRHQRLNPVEIPRMPRLPIKQAMATDRPAPDRLHPAIPTIETPPPVLRRIRTLRPARRTQPPTRSQRSRPDKLASRRTDIRTRLNPKLSTLRCRTTERFRPPRRSIHTSIRPQDTLIKTRAIQTQFRPSWRATTRPLVGLRLEPSMPAPHHPEAPIPVRSMPQVPRPEQRPTTAIDPTAKRWPRRLSSMRCCSYPLSPTCTSCTG